MPGAKAQESGVKFAEPDFSMPRDVIANARKALTEADKAPASTGVERLRAVLELCTAQEEIEPDSIFAQPAIIAAQAATPGLSAPSRAMLLTLQAKILNDIYQRRSYAYNQVSAPDRPLPENVAEWSGRQFVTVIDSLIDKAIATAEVKTTPLRTFAACLDYSDSATDYIPTVYDFILQQGIDYLRNYNGDNYDTKAKTSRLATLGLAEAKAASAPYFYWKTECIKLDDSTGKSRNKALEELYRQYADIEAARYVLAQICRGGFYEEDEIEGDPVQDKSANHARDERIKTIEASLKQFPKWEQNAILKNALARLTMPTLKTDVENRVMPGKEFKVTMKSSFVQKAKLTIYRLPLGTDTYYNARQIRKIGKQVATRTVVCHGTDTVAEETFSVTQPGTYVLISSISTPTCSDTSVSTFKADAIDGISIGGTDRNAAIAVDFATGAPLRDVRVSLEKQSYRRDRKSASQYLGLTDKDGILYFDAPEPATGYSNYLSYKYKGHTYKFDSSLHTARPVKPETGSVQAYIFTDRPLYHPGDSIHWAIAAGSDSLGIATPLAGTTLTITLYDTNNQRVATTTAVTDSYGRANGAFTTKKGGLTGYQRISVTKDGKQMAQSNVMVSDFKLPIFYAEINTVERGIPEAGAVRITGKATTFSGMPVIGAKVDATVFEAMRWFRFSPARKLGELNTSTNAAGEFSIDIPAALLENSEGTQDYNVQLVVTATDASTAEISKAFTTGKPYTLVNSDIAANIDTSTPLVFTPEAYNADNTKATIAVKWTIGHYTGSKLTDKLLEGAATTGTPLSIDLGKLPAGNYALVTAPADTSLADGSQLSNITLYNVARNEMPAEAPRLFVPKTSFVIGEGGDTSITVGINADEAYVYEAVRYDNKLSSLTVHKLTRGFHTISINVPGAVENPEACLMTIANGKLQSADISLKRPAPKPAQIVAESFRDRLTPGATERWRLRLVDGKDAPMQSAAAIATMYNRALEELANPSWPTKFGFLHFSNSLSVFHQYSYNATGYVACSVNTVREQDIQWPEFRFVGHRYLGNMLRYRTGGVKMAYATAKSEAEAMDGAVLEESVVMNSAADLAAPANGIEAEMTEESEKEAPAEDKKFDFRVAEVLQAFWMPSLTADENGNIDLTFTVPNANGSWTFRATGWDKSWTSASYAAECIASKPVMVQPNLPRFLRAGDSARLLANVYNNTEERSTVDVVVELFNIADGKVTSTATSTLELDAKGSGLAAIDVTVPTDVNAIGYRVKAMSGTYADGEQTAIPVLASSSTVIESTEFYLNPGDSKPFTFTVKNNGKADLILQYCQNPVWTIVKAMRGISAKQSNTSTGLVSQLFSALAAKDIIGGNPAVASAIEEWSKNKSEDALTSMLAKNEELKKLILEQTPWVQTASDQTQRMEALAQFLDKEKTTTAIASTCEALAKLQNKNGGFPWGKWNNESSPWCTETVITTLGLANSLGLLDADKGRLNSLLQPAYDYIQKQATKPDMPSTDRSLALIHALFPQLRTGKAASQLIDRTIADIAANWKNDNTTTKAYDILILKATKPDTAAEIFASLRQFGVHRKDMGVCFPSVNDIRSYATIIQAYAAMNAPKDEIDALRQWIIVQAQATDDLGAYNPDYIISALMFTGSDWTAVPVEQNVRINGHAITIDKMESATGYFAQRINADSRKIEITVSPNGITPSYGSVISISRQPMKNIKAKAGRDVSVEKRVLVERGGQWVETNEFNLGERVRVQLTINAGRTMEYVSIDDERPATFEPVEQMPGFVYDGALAFYRENLDASTRLFISYLPKGTYHVTYDMTAAVAGKFMSGIATLQSQYAPELTAHSGSASIIVK